jgi:signal transduction histidine kinase
MREYAKVRFVLMRGLMNVPARRESLLLLHEGMDRAIGAAIDRYSQRREEVRARFISILGHDLRDPLSTVMVSTEVLATSDGVSAEHRAILGRMARACDRMQRMIGEVLDFARGHLGGGIPANPTLNDMAAICRTVVDDALATHADRTIKLETSGDLRGPFDRDRVTQALGNLVGNAIQHSQGPIEVRAHESEDRGHVITTVTSHGAAISPEVKARLFDPFARGDDSTAHHGLGLGLYIVQQITLAHGGMIDVTSDAAATSFSIRWPRVHEENRLNAARG